MNCETSRYGCGQLFPSSCSPYTGSDLTVLNQPTDLPCNANMNDVIKVLDSTLKTLMVSNDFTGLNPMCFTFNPATVTAAQLHQLEITDICATQASLTALQNLFENLNIGTELVTINLGALAPSAAPCLVTPSTYQLISVLNVLVSAVNALNAAVGI